MNSIVSCMAKTDNFEEGEIRCIAPENPPTIKNIESWDGILRNKQPVYGDFGIDKDRNRYWFTNKDGWRKITP